MTVDKLIDKLKSDAIMDSYNFQGYSKKQKEQVAEWLEELKSYRAIGTVEEFKALKEPQKEVWKSNFSLEQYKADTDTAWQCGYNKAIKDFAEKMINLVNEFPTVEDEFGELRPMTIEEMCNEIAEQLKGEKQ